MMIVNPKSFGYRKHQVNQEKEIYFVSGMVNWNAQMRPNFFHPPTDIIETDTKLIIRVEIAGLSNDNFSIHFEPPVLSIQGIRQDPLTKRTFHQMEIQYGEFSSDIEINIPIDTENITAEYQDGILIIEMPKRQPTQIIIESE